MSAELGARVVIAGTHSGVGKTTVATGLMAAFAAAGTRVAAAKVGPDFIDPAYHALATGRPGRNLDAWICGVDAVGPLAGRAAAGSELLVIEGVMGLFDGAADGSPSSTADIARLLDAPVVLVVDAASMSASVAALVGGYRDHDPTVRVAGVILNKVGSDRHEAMLRTALVSSGLPVLGVLRRDDALTWRSRHLGLIPVAEEPAVIAASLARLAHKVTMGCDLQAIAAIAATAPARSVDDPPLPSPAGRARIAVAAGPAFTFAYQDNLEALAAAGAEVVAFDPMTDAELPDGSDALVVGGGFPEVYGPQLAANSGLLERVRQRVAAGMPVWAECGGLLWLSRRIDHSALVGIIDAEGSMTKRLTLGYRRATVLIDNPVAAAGSHLRGHEFHYSKLDPAGGALLGDEPDARPHGHATATMLATYLHLHLGGDPEPARRFVAAAVAARSSLAEP